MHTVKIPPVLRAQTGGEAEVETTLAAAAAAFEVVAG